MARWPNFRISLAAIGLTFLPLLGLAAPQEVYISATSTPASNTGTSAEPLDGSTQQKFDAILHQLSADGVEGIAIHLGPGLFETRGAYESAPQAMETGYWLNSGWKIQGAGRGVTTVKLVAFNYIDAVTGQQQRWGANTVFALRPWNQHDIEIKDLTIDCGYLGFGSEVAETFTAPVPDTQFTVTVRSSAWAIADKQAYIQGVAPFRRIGTYEIVAVPDSTHVVLKSFGDTTTDPPPGESIAFPCHIGPLVNTCGILIGDRRCTVERVRVTNTGTPHYEWPCGIFILAIKPDPLVAEGNVIRDCIVDNVYGQYAALIYVAANNPDTGDNGTTVSVLVENNWIIGNGTNFGTGAFGCSNSIWRGNVIRDCRTGWFSDVGFNRNILIKDNVFSGNGCGVQIGGGFIWDRFQITGNHFVIPNGGTGFRCQPNVTNSLFTDNVFAPASGAHGGAGFSSVPTGSTGNAVMRNRMESAFVNRTDESFGVFKDNHTETGRSPAGLPEDW